MLLSVSNRRDSGILGMMCLAYRPVFLTCCYFCWILSVLNNISFYLKPQKKNTCPLQNSGFSYVPILRPCPYVTFSICSDQAESRAVSGVQCLLGFYLPINAVPLGEVC